jgi:hypothetical protein
MTRRWQHQTLTLSQAGSGLSRITQGNTTDYSSTVCYYTSGSIISKSGWLRASQVSRTGFKQTILHVSNSSMSKRTEVCPGFLLVVPGSFLALRIFTHPPALDGTRSQSRKAIMGFRNFFLNGFLFSILCIPCGMSQEFSSFLIMPQSYYFSLCMLAPLSWRLSHLIFRLLLFISISILQ